MIIEEGFWDKEVVERQVTAHEALKIMVPINEAKRLWEVNIYLISLFLCRFYCAILYSFKTEETFQLVCSIISDPTCVLYDLGRCSTSGDCQNTFILKKISEKCIDSYVEFMINLSRIKSKLFRDFYFFEVISRIRDKNKTGGIENG